MARSRGSRKHGHTARGGWMSPTYVSWHAMRQRVRDSNTAYYHRYGGRGITMDPRWEDFENFLRDMGERPPNPEGWTSRKSYWSLDRIDNEKGYGPDNCRWASPKEQASHRQSPWPQRRLNEAARRDDALTPDVVVLSDLP